MVGHWPQRTHLFMLFPTPSRTTRQLNFLYLQMKFTLYSAFFCVCVYVCVFLGACE